MKIHVGSLNPTKIQAVKNILENHDQFGASEVVGVDPEVEEFGHPKTLDATIKGAQDRARAVIKGCDLSVGIESGMFTANGTRSGYMEVTVCALFDSKDFYLGFGPAFEWPAKMVERILAGEDGSQAFKSLGLTDHEKVGIANGGIHVLTHGKIDRTKLNELAVMMALIHLENPQHYGLKP